ncbi:MAG: hypothetical protein P4L33_04250 [Capsulimonadaceae bacterium]|nr:hypothetical protein [Capsulimonadaceae bacterium]
MARGKRIDDDLRLIVANALMAGQGITEVAGAYNLPKATVSRIRNEFVAKGQPAIDVQKLEQVVKLEQVGTLPTDSDATPDELISEFVSTALAALIEMSKVATDPAYLRRYPPQQIALLYGVMADKVARIIEATSGGEVSEAGEGDTRLGLSVA